MSSFWPMYSLASIGNLMKCKDNRWLMTMHSEFCRICLTATDVSNFSSAFILKTCLFANLYLDSGIGQLLAFSPRLNGPWSPSLALSPWPLTSNRRSVVALIPLGILAFWTKDLKSCFEQRCESPKLHFFLFRFLPIRPARPDSSQIHCGRLPVETPLPFNARPKLVFFLSRRWALIGLCPAKSALTFQVVPRNQKLAMVFLEQITLIINEIHKNSFTFSEVCQIGMSRKHFEGSCSASKTKSVLLAIGSVTPHLRIC